MEDFKVGDVVAPKTKISREKYGIGIVTSVVTYPRERINVFSVSRDGIIEHRGFSPNSLQIIDAPNSFHQMINKSYDKYNSLIEELKFS